MTATYVAKAVRPGKTSENPHGGTLQAFYVDFEKLDGTIEEGVYWRRKEGNTPNVGETYEGEITQGDYGPRFKQSKQGGFSSTTSSGSQNHSQKKWQPEAERDPERSARILRQHSQEMALRMLSLDAVQTSREDFQFNFEDVRKLADQFDKDVNEAGQAARSAQGSSVGAPQGGDAHSPGVASGPEPTSPPAEDLKDLEMAIDTAQPTPAKARELIARYMLSELPADEQNRACNQLCNTADLETQAKTIKALRERTEKWTGKPLPAGPPESDESIPF